MAMRKFLGWIFLIVGITLMISPFISGLTGYFALTSFSVLPTGTNFEIAYTVIGFVLAIFGYYLIRPEKEHILS